MKEDFEKFEAVMVWEENIVWINDDDTEGPWHVKRHTQARNEKYMRQSNIMYYIVIVEDLFFSSLFRDTTDL